MAKKKPKPLQFLSTPMKYLINTWGPMQALVSHEKIGGLEVAAQGGDKLLDDSVMHAAFNGPFSRYIRSLTALLIKLEQVLMYVSHQSDDSIGVSNELRTLLGCDAVEPEGLNQIKIEKAKKALYGAINGFFPLLEKFHDDACDLIITHLRENEISLGDNERDELRSIERVDELVRRLDTLSMDTIEAEEVLNIDSYFRYKTSIVVKNALSRTLKRHGDTEIKQAIRHLKPCFDAIKKDELRFVAENITPLEKEVSAVLKAGVA